MLKKLNHEKRRILKEWVMIVIGAALVAFPFSFLLYPNDWVYWWSWKYWCYFKSNITN